jgi:glycosyltransferase involved in cell wall biosynthesis
MGLCGIKYAKTRNVPIVSSYETNICQYLEYYRLKFLEQPSWKYLKWFHGKCDRIFCPSQVSARLLTDHGFKNISIWERGIESESFSPEFRDISLRKSLGIDDKLVFTYVGRVSPEKDLSIFIKTAKMLNEKYKNRIHFLIVGDGPCLKDLKGVAPDNMTFTGFMSGIELSKIYASSDIFLFTSPTETLGFVILEAMASGLAIIACSSGGVSDNLIDGFNGLACREKNELDFFLASERLILDFDYRHALSKNARNYALDKSWNKTFDKLILDYNNIINEKEKLTLISCS